MRKNLWSRVLVVLSLFSLTAYAEPPVTHEPGTRVSIRLASGELPEAQKMVQALEAAGGEHLVRVTRRNTDGQQELTIDLWGNTVPQADIPQTLRDGFPALATADIQVSTLDPKDRPHGDRINRLRRELRDEPGTQVKRRVKIIEKVEKVEEAPAKTE